LTAGSRLAGGICVALLLAGCGSSASGQSASVPRSRTFIDLVPALPSDLDESGTPGTATELLQSWSSELVRPSAAPPGANTVLPGADSVVPYLATSWHESPGGDYTFELRRGVRGSTGDPFTAVTVLGRYAVRINVSAPSPFLLGVLAWYDEGIYDRRLYLAHATASDPWAEHWGATHSATFGAYYVSLFLASRRLVLLANPHSWVHPYYRKVEIKEISSAGHRVAALLRGSADHTSAIDWKDYTDVALYGAASHVSASILQTGPTVESWLLNVARGPLANVLVRRALNLAVERSDLSGAIYYGYATPDVLAVPSDYGQAQPAGYDLAEARRLLAAAGYGKGFKLRVYVDAEIASGDEEKELALLTNQLSEVDVTLEPVVVYNEDQLLAIAQAHRLDSTIEDIAPALGGAGFTLIEDDDPSIDGTSPAAVDGYRNATLEALLARLRTTPVGATSKRILARAEQIVDADVPAVNFFELPVENLTRSDITGYGAYAEPVTYYEYLHPAR